MSAQEAKKMQHLVELELKASHGLALQKMRTAYFTQLLVDIASKTAKNMDKLWEGLKDKNITTSLTLMDNCCMSGPESFCSAWSTALGSLCTTGVVDVAAVLLQCNIKPVTSQGKSLLGGSTKPFDGGDGDDDEEALPSQVLTINDLLSYGQSEIVPPADILEGLRFEIQQQLMAVARTDFVCLLAGVL